jgi:hypothetical protein
MATLALSGSPLETRFLRVWMTESSNTCDLHGADDIRNCVGYAIQDIRAGRTEAGQFIDVSQNAAYCSSSIDPWHSAGDVNATGRGQHTGFDLFFSSGLTNNLPALIPISLLYGTPEDAAAQIAYLNRRGYPIRGIEMGEEPDGKHMLPEDYAALYLQAARAIHKVDPQAKLGGPIFEGVNEDIRVWPDAHGRTSWMGRFIDYLRAHGRLPDLAFVSFEHYPFDRCDITWQTLYSEPRLMKHILEVWRADGVPRDVPLIVSESHLSAQLSGPMSTIFAALWLADNIGSFFEGGGAAFFHSPIQPQPVEPSCLGWATWSNFVSDRDYNITGYTSLYFAARMINMEWAQHRSGMHKMFPSTTAIRDAGGNDLLTSYALSRPDGNWSLMLVNRDEHEPHRVQVLFRNAGTEDRYFEGPVSFTTFGSEQYAWRDQGKNSHADPDSPPAGRIMSSGRQAIYTLPKASITVLRGRISGG